jgi:hypothetical protein
MAKDKKLDKILRIGIVQGGRIIEERLLRHKEAITIGQAPKNKFMIPSPRVPITYTLIDVKGGRYILCFEKGMLGKILVDEEILDLKSIAKRRLAERKDAKFRFPLSDESRGKIVLGDVTLLFQFVTPPPEVPRLQLPAEAKGAWWRNMDKALLGTFFLSLLLLGGSGGYGDFWWRYTGRYRAPTKKAGSKIFQTLVKASAKAEEEKKDEKGEAKDGDEDKGIADDQTEEAVRDEPSKLDEMGISESEAAEVGLGEEGSFDDALAEGAGMGDDIDVSDVADRVKESFREPAAARPSGLSAEERAERAKRLVSDRTVVGLVGSEFGAGSGGFSDSLSGGLSRIKDGEAFGSGTLEVGGGGLGSDYLGEEDGLGRIAEEFGPGGGLGGMPGGPGGGPNLAAFKPDDIGPEKGPGSVEVIKGPKKKLEAKKPKVEEKKWKLSLSGGRSFVGGKIDKQAVNKYLRARSSAFQKCYVMVARKNPNVGGKLTLRIKIDLSGRATAKVVSDQTGDPRLAKCIEGKIRQWAFPKPAGKPVEFVIPFVFRAL